MFHYSWFDLLAKRIYTLYLLALVNQGKIAYVCVQSRMILFRN